MPNQQFHPYQEPNIYQDPSMIYPDMSLQNQLPYQGVMYPEPQPQQQMMYPDYPQEPMMYSDNQPQQPITYPEVPDQQSMMYPDMQPQQQIMYPEPEFQQQPIMYPSQNRPNSDWYIPEGAIPEGFEFNDEKKPNDVLEAYIQPSVVPFGEQYQNAYGKYTSFFPLFLKLSY